MKRTTFSILVAIWTCDFAEGQFGGGGFGGGGGLLGALVPGGCPMPTPVKNFDLEKVPTIIDSSNAIAFFVGTS